MIRKLSSSPEETSKIGIWLASYLKNGTIIAMYGETGSGKTTLTKAIAGEFGISRDDVSSPTFSLVNIYRGRLTIFHIDLYRLPSLQEAEESGVFAHDPGDGITIIEWPQIASAILPNNTISIKINYISDSMDQREIIITGINE